VVQEGHRPLAVVTGASSGRQSESKDDPADVARKGFEAMVRGDDQVVTGFKNKVQTTMANVTPAQMLAARSAKQSKPGGGET
jgi:uncharacterized protein